VKLPQRLNLTGWKNAMRMFRFAVAVFSAASMIFGARVANSQNYPVKPVRIITAEVGGGSDLLARQIAQGLASNLGQQVLVDNRGGAGGILAVQSLIKAPPDGYTLLLYSGGIWILPLLQDDVPYDPVRDLSPISLTNRTPNILVVHPALPVRSVKELIMLAKARPQALSYGSGGTGTSGHLAAELFKTMANVSIVRIAYKGTGPGLNDLIAGQVQLSFPNASSAMPHIKSGRLRGLAVTSAQPSLLAPGLPTVAASGLPGYESASVYGLFAPASTPLPFRDRVYREIARVLNRPGMKERLLNSGLETVGSSPEELAATIKLEMAKWGMVIKQAGMRGQ